MCYKDENFCSKDFPFSTFRANERCLCLWQCFNFFLSSFATLRSSCRFNIFNSQWKRTLHYWLNLKKMMKSLSKKTSLHTSFRFGVLFPYGILKSMSCLEHQVSPRMHKTSFFTTFELLPFQFQLQNRL